MAKAKTAPKSPRSDNDTFCLQWAFARSSVAGVFDAVGSRAPSRCRLQFLGEGGVLSPTVCVCVEAPDGRWEIYVTDSDGIEMFQRYANGDEAAVLVSASKAEPHVDGSVRVFAGWPER